MAKGMMPFMKKGKGKGKKKSKKGADLSGIGENQGGSFMDNLKKMHKGGKKKMSKKGMKKG